MQILRRVATWTLAVTLATGWLQPAWAGKKNRPGGGVPVAKLPVLRIPKRAEAPVIDGAMQEGEWDVAVAVSGVANQKNNLLHPRPTTYYLAWDEGNLYMACRTWVMPDHKPRVANRLPGHANVSDAGLELHFKPMGANVGQGQTESSFKWMVNALGIAGNFNRASVGQLFKDWLPEFDAAARLTEPGSAPKGGRWLEIEFAGSVEDFELTGPNQAGDEWKLMLGFNHLPGWMQARIPNNGSYFEASGYCQGVFVEDEPVGQILMQSFPGLPDGHAAATLRVVNPTKKPAKLQCTVQVNGIEEPLLEKSPVLEVEPGQTAEFVLDEALPEDVPHGDAFFRINAGETTLVQYFAYWQRGYPEKYLTRQPDKDAFPLRATFNPVRFNLMLVGDAYYLPDPDAATAMRYRITPEGSDEVILEGRLETPITYYYRDLLQLPELAPGTYAATGVLELADGTELGPVTRTFRKLDEAEVFSEWWNNDKGDYKRVLPPFTGVRREGDEVSVWGRTYKLGALGLPESMVSQGQDVLAAPARLVAVVEGREVVIPAAGDPEFTADEDWRVSFRGEHEAAGLRFTSSGWVEQDGLIYLEITYQPAGETPVPVDALRIEWPVRPDVADCLLCIGAGGNFSAHTATVIEDAEVGPVWSTLTLGRAGAHMTVGSFFPSVWLGNEERGFYWWADNDKGWVPENEVPAHEVERTPEAMVLRNNLIGSPFEVAEARTLALSCMGSPFRPLVKGWRYSIRSENGTFGGPHKRPKDPETGELAYDGWHLLTPPTDDPEQYGPMWAEFKKHADAKVRARRWSDPYQARRRHWVHNSIPLMGYGWKSDDRSVRYFMSEWTGRESYTKSNRDYYIYLCERAIREGGIRTLYWDIFFPYLSGTLQNNTAYELPDGRIQPSYFGWNKRRFMMRLYAVMDANGITPGSNVAHATNAYLLVATPWVDAILDGEFHTYRPDSGMDWPDGYPKERMRAFSVAENFGTVISWMDKMQGPRDFRREEARKKTAYIRLFDSWSEPNRTTLPEAALRFGINDEKVQYVPYWRNELVTSEDEEILVSLWTLPDRVALQVFNYSGEESKEVTLTVDLAELGLKPELPWQEFLRLYDLEEERDKLDVSLNYHAGTLTIPTLPPHRGRLLGIRRY